MVRRSAAMSFEDLLRERLGPLRDLVRRPRRRPAPQIEPADLFYRRAAGIEARVRPEETWATITVGVAPRLAARRADEARRMLALTAWTTARRAGLDPSRLWRAVEDGLLVYARSDPGRPLTGVPGALAGAAPDRKIARRAAAWPTVAVETAVEIAPMPFMPRGRDLAGAEGVGARIASLEKGHEVFGLTVTGSAVTGRRLRRLAALLTGRWTVADVLDPFDGRDRYEVRKILALLDDVGLLEVRDGPPAPAPVLATPSEGQLTWLGHAAVLVQSPSTNVLVDPLFFAPSEPPDRWDADPRFDPRSLPRIDAILITHGDNDHLNPNSLGLLDPSTPVLIPECPANPAAFQVDLKGMLRVLGFDRVVEMPVGSTLRVGDFDVSAWPFEGEDWGLDLAKVTYLVEGDALSVYLSADARRMDGVMAALGRRSRRIDVAFMGVSGNAEPHVTPADLGYGNFYADWVPPARHNEWVQHCAGPVDAVESVRQLEPMFAFGYAAGGARYIRTAYSDDGDHATFARLLGQSDAECRAVDLPLGRPVPKSALPGYAAAR